MHKLLTTNGWYCYLRQNLIRSSFSVLGLLMLFNEEVNVMDKLRHNVLTTVCIGRKWRNLEAKIPLVVQSRRQRTTVANFIKWKCSTIRLAVVGTQHFGRMERVRPCWNFLSSSSITIQNLVAEQGHYIIMYWVSLWLSVTEHVGFM